jgi:hypothetical protein
MGQSRQNKALLSHCLGAREIYNAQGQRKVVLSGQAVWSLHLVNYFSTMRWSDTCPRQAQPIGLPTQFTGDCEIPDGHLAALASFTAVVTWTKREWNVS